MSKTFPEKITEKLVIDSRLDAVIRARHWAARRARAAGFDGDAVFAIELAVGEALTNAITHAYHGEAGHEIHLALTIDPDKLRLGIRDFGRKFDLSTYSPPDLDVPNEGGYGIFLMRQMMDEVIYDTSCNEGTCLELVKYRSTRHRAQGSTK